MPLLSRRRGRTRLKQLKFTGEDFKCLAVIAVALVAIACTRFFVPDWRKNQPPCGAYKMRPYDFR